MANNNKFIVKNGISVGATDIVDANGNWIGPDGSGSGLDADLLDGQHGSHYLDWTNTTNKPDPVITVTLTGDVTGTANTTLTDLASGTVSVATTIAPNSVALGTDTTGNYVVGITAGGGIAVTGTAGEGWSPTVAHADTSSVSNLVSDNADNTVLQDISLSFDTYGHVTGASAGTKTITDVNRLITYDDRIKAPSDDPAYRLSYGFTSWNNNNTSPYADYLHLRSYSDASGGSDNLLMFNKGSIGIRLWQQTWGSGTAYSTYKDVAFTSDIGNGAFTVTAGAGLTGGGQLGTANQSGATSVTVSHADTSSQASVDNSGATVIQDVTLDTYGHVTGLASKTLGYSDVGAAPTSHDHSYLAENSTITFGNSYLQWTDLPGNSGTGGNGSTPYNPTYDWYHHIIANHGNGNGYYVDMALCFHSNDHYINRMVAGNLSTVKLWNDGNDGSGSGLDADLLDGNHASAFASSSHTHTFDSLTSKASGTGTYTTSGDFRAPIFYDSNDTGYYVDPNGRSKLYGTKTNSLYIGMSNDFSDRGNSGDNIYMRHPVQTGGTFWGMRISMTCPLASHTAGFYPFQYYTDENNDGTEDTLRCFIDKDGTIQSGASVRAPIFYDSNDTGYYVDPASSSGSRLSHLYIGNVAGSNDGSWNARAKVIGSSHARLDVVSNSDGIVTTMYSHTGQGMGKVGTMSNHPLALMAEGSNIGGYVYNGSIRSPIFYDSDNTGYYVDPNSTSRINNLTVTGTTNIGVDKQFFDISVGGDANTYYPVGISGAAEFGFNSYSVSRHYAWAAPDTWYTASHRGGLTFTWLASGDGAWGGNDHSLRVVQFNETYSSMVAGFTLAVSHGPYIIWLRGGGATYRIHHPAGNAGSATVYLTGFTAANGAVYDIRTNTSSVASEITNKTPISGNATLYDNGNRVLDQGSTDQAKSGYLQSNSSLRAPIFYDSDDTGRYIDPNSTSSGRFAGYLGLGSYQYNDRMSGTYGVSIYHNNYPSIGFHNQYYSGSGAGDNRNWLIYRNAANYLTVWNSADGDFCMFYPGGYVGSTGSFRAPIFYDSNDTSYYADFSSTGTSINTAGDIVSNSDRKLKENVEPITDAINKIKQITGVTYNKIGETKRTSGVIAQDVEVVLPEVVTQQGEYLSVAYGNMVGLLIEAIKEQQKQIDDLKSEIKSLRGN